MEGVIFIDKNQVMEHMALAAAAYNETQPHAAGQAQAFYSAPNGVQFFVRRGGAALHLIFRGSNSRLDWGHNLAFGKMEIPYGNARSRVRVHGGFLYAYKSPHVRGQIHGLVADAECIRISGHSYGAALAALCALDIQYNFPKTDVECYLFGCPRIGNRAFMQSYNKRVIKTIRVENGNDVVTKIPFAIMGFRHVGAQYHVGKRRRPWRLSAADHYPMAYYQGILNRLLE